MDQQMARVHRRIQEGTLSRVLGSRAVPHARCRPKRVVGVIAVQIPDAWTEAVSGAYEDYLGGLGYTPPPGSGDKGLAEVPKGALLTALEKASAASLPHKAEKVGVETLDSAINLFWVWHFFHWHARRQDSGGALCNYDALDECGADVSDRLVTTLDSFPGDVRKYICDFVESDTHWRHGPNLNWLTTPRDERLDHLPAAFVRRYAEAKRDLAIESGDKCRILQSICQQLADPRIPRDVFTPQYAQACV